MTFPYSGSRAILEGCVIDRKVVHLTVRTPNLGLGSSGGVHVFDAKGHVLADQALPFQRQDSAGNNVFRGEVPLNKLTGFDRTSLQATAYLDVPGQPRDWSGINRPVVEQQRNVGLSLGTNHSEVATFTSSTPLYSGLLSADFYTQLGPMSDSHLGSRQFAVTKLSLVPDTAKNFFGKAKSIAFTLSPLDDVHYGGIGGRGESVAQGIEDLNAASTITATLQGDGSYLAQAPPNHALFTAYSEAGYDPSVLTGIIARLSGGGVKDDVYGAGYNIFPGF